MNYIKEVTHRKNYISAILLFIFASYLRLMGVFTKSFPFTYDIGRDLLAARDIATFEKLTLIGPTTGLEGLFYGPSWYYILALLYFPLDGDPSLITGFIVITGIVTFIIAYYLGKRIGGNYFALLWSLLLAFSPAMIGLSSQIWSPNLIPIFWIFTFMVIYFIYVKRYLVVNFFLLGILCSLIVDMEIVVGLLFSSGILLSLILFLRKALSFRNIAIGILGFITVLIPRIIFDLRHDNLLSSSFVKGIQHMILEGGDGSSTTPLVQKIMLIFYAWSESLALGNHALGLIFLSIIILLSIYSFRKMNEKLKFYFKLVTLTLGVSIVGIMLMGHDIWGHYLVMFPPLFITLFSIVLCGAFNIKRIKTPVIIFSFLIIVLNINPINRFNELSRPLWEGDASVYRNQIAAVDYVYREAKDQDFKYIVYTPAVHDYPYRYLFSWYGERAYNKLPTEESPQLLFVIVEPDYEKPERLVEWLAQRENDGTIVSENPTKGGIIVQKRVLNNN